MYVLRKTWFDPMLCLLAKNIYVVKNVSSELINLILYTLNFSKDTPLMIFSAFLKKYTMTGSSHFLQPAEPHFSHKISDRILVRLIS